MKQTKQLVALGVIITLGVMIYVLIYRDDDIEPVMPSWPEGLSQAEKVEIMQQRWEELDKVALDAPYVTNMVWQMIAKDGDSALSMVQKRALADKLEAWLYSLKTGKYEDHVAFRDPDYWNVTLKSVEGIWKMRHSVPLKGGGKADTSTFPALDSLDQLPESEWARFYYDGWTSLRFDGIRPESIHFNVRRWRAKTDDLLDLNRFHPSNAVRLKGNRFHTKTKEPLKGYHVKPDDVVRKDGWIVWARFRAGYDTVGYGGYIAPVELALYWSPGEDRWLAGECLIGRPPDDYIPEGGWPYPEFEF